MAPRDSPGLTGRKRKHDPRSLGAVLLLIAPISVGGCMKLPGHGETLTIATSWPEADRTRLESGFGRWLEGQRDARAVDGIPRITWLTMAPDVDPARFANRRRAWWDPRPRAPDILLGGSPSGYRRMAADRLLLGPKTPGEPAWLEVRRPPIGWATRADGGGVGRTFDDPRHDPLAREWAKGELATGSWAEGYARLVRAAGGPRRIGRRPGSALAAVERGEADACPASAECVHQPLVFLPGSRTTDRVEGVAMAAGTADPSLARSFLDYLRETGEARLPGTGATENARADADAMLADLLGATLVDAQDELWEAWRVLKPGRQRERLEIWMTQAPPWPPASVLKLGERDGSGALVGALVEQIAADPAVRAWLLRSWLAPERPLDGALLGELVAAADGRLVREPRFRAWLRAEWTAWARQRYRRVARQAAGGGVS